jgi:hypothetical protein
MQEERERRWERESERINEKYYGSRASSSSRESLPASNNPALRVLDKRKNRDSLGVSFLFFS